MFLKIRSWPHVFQLLLGCFVMGIGIGLVHRANFGSDPLTMLVSGLDIHLPLGISLWNWLINIVLAVIAFFIDKEKVRITTLLTPFCGSFGISLGLLININPYLSLVLGVLIMAFGIANIINADTGMDAYNAFLCAFKDLFNLSYSLVRWACDLIFIIIGYLLGASWGIGTLVCLFGIGLLANYLTRYTNFSNIMRVRR